MIVIPGTLVCHSRQCGLEPSLSFAGISHTSVSPIFFPLVCFFHFNFLSICGDLSEGLVF